MLERIRNHIGIFRNGDPLSYYRRAINRRYKLICLMLKNKGETTFNFYKNLQAIVNTEDYIMLKEYLNDGINDGIRESLETILKPGMIVFDVGANAGVYTMISSLLVSEFGKVFAFEPVPRLLNKLNNNIKLNSIKNVVINKKAVSNRTGKLNFYISNSDGFGSVYKSRKSTSEHIEVDSITLDDFIINNNIKFVDLIKIDVEGYELDVIDGAENSLKNGMIGAFIVEFNKETQGLAGYSYIELSESLIKYGFSWYHLPIYKNKIISVSDWSVVFRQCDLIAINKDLSQTF